MKIASTHRVMVRPLALLGLAWAVSLFIGVEGAAAQSDAIDEAVNAHGVTPTLELTPAQRSAIYQEVHKDTSKVAPSRFATHVGADVPPTIEAPSVAGRYSSQQSGDQAVQVHRGGRQGRPRRSDRNARYRGNRPEA
jgi:hypothetical protein